MRRYLCAGLLAGLLGSGVAASEIHIVTEAWEPYVFLLDGKPTGLDFAQTKAVLEQMGHTVRLEFCPWKRCLAMLQDKEADAILDVQTGDRNERKQFLYFPDEPLSTAQSVIFYRSSSPFRYKGLGSLTGKRVGVSWGYVYSPEFDNSSLFVHDPAHSLEELVRKLALGRVDLALINRTVGLYTAQRLGVRDQLGFDPTPIATGTYYLGFAKKPGYQAMAQEFSRRLKLFKHSATYEGLLKVYGDTP